jgi:hypothetical protein
MPIQYYDPTWYNNRPPQAQAKLEAKLIVTLVPDSTDFFSRRGDNTLSTAELTAKYGPTVFADYDLDFGKAEAEASGEGVDASSDADDEGEGDSLGSQDSDDEEAELSDAPSMTSFIDPQSASDDDEEYTQPAASDDGQEEDGQEEDAKAQFAQAYDVDMDEIFGDESANESV